MAEVKALVQDTNIEVLRCYKDLFDIQFYLTSHGSIIIFVLFVVQIILTVIYCKKYIFDMQKYLFNLMQIYVLDLSKKIKVHFNNKIDKPLSPKINKLNNIKANPKKHSSIKILSNINSHENDNIPKQNSKIQGRNKSIILNKFSQNTAENQKISKENLLMNPKYKVINKKKSLFYKNNNINNNLNSDNQNIIILGGPIDIDIENYIKTDPDDMDYDDAIRDDQRTFCEYFWDNIKSNILIINIFCNKEKLNPWPIKSLLFILNIDLYFLVNGLFFTEDYLREMLYDKDINIIDFFERFFERIYYITLIGIIINYIMDFFFFKEKIVKKLLKREKNNLVILKYEMAQIIKKIKNIYNSFIIICFLAALFIWYYTFCFNNIYPSMKKEWILTSVIVIIAMQIFNFLKIIFVSVIRFIAIKCKSERLFKFSQFLS